MTIKDLVNELKKYPESYEIELFAMTKSKCVLIVPNPERKKITIKFDTEKIINNKKEKKS